MAWTQRLWPCGLTAPAQHQPSGQEEDLWMLGLEQLHITPETQLTRCYQTTKAACDSRGGLPTKAEAECMRKTFVSVLQCDQKQICNCVKLFTQQSNNWRSSLLLPLVKFHFIFGCFNILVILVKYILPYRFTAFPDLPHDLKILWKDWSLK